jgi:NAD+ diphosphatase
MQGPHELLCTCQKQAQVANRAFTPPAPPFTRTRSPMSRTTPAFTDGALDRLSGHRGEPGRMEDLMNSPQARFAVFCADKLVMDVPAGGANGIRWHARDQLPKLLDGVPPVLLGVDANGVAHFAAQAEDPELALNQDLCAIDLRSIALQGLADNSSLGVAAQARTLLHWHTRHRFCANCGAATQPGDAGYKRVCLSCAAEHFPRTDPVVIIAVTRGDKMLLGRSARFAATMYSTLAGFVEPGETAEDAARREVFEEAGIRVGRISYVMSQPWPFPANLMIGLVGEAESDAITIDPDELADARWFSLDEVRAMHEGRHPEGLEIPPSISIAHHLIRKIID